MIGITGAHVATLDLEACSRLGIVVCNTAGGGPGWRKLGPSVIDVGATPAMA
jgi:hypothetical protein